MKTNLRITCLLKDGGIEVTKGTGKGAHWFLIGQEDHGNRYWVIRAWSLSQDDRAKLGMAWSRIEGLMKDIAELKLEVVKA